MLQESDFLSIGQPLGLHRGVGDEEQNADADENGDDTEGDEHDAPASEAGAGDVLEAVGDGAADDLAEAQSEVPEGEARGGLGLGVVLAADEHEGGTDGGLEDAEEDAGHEEGLVVVRGGTASRGNSWRLLSDMKSTEDGRELNIPHAITLPASHLAAGTA